MKIPAGMAKVLFIIAAGLLLYGCSGKSEPGSVGKAGEITIVTSFYPMYLHVINIARDIPGIDVVNMTEPQYGCLHDYQLSPRDMKILEKAQIFVINGAGMESFLDRVIKQLPQLKVIEASRGMELPDDGHEGNPHVWVSVSGAIGQVKNIADQLAACDAANADKYKKNARDYIERLEVLKDKMHGELDGLKNRKIVTFHEAFSYFAREFGLTVAAVVEREPGTEPGAKELAETIEMIKDAGVKALFAEPQYPAKSAEIIAGETGTRVYVLDPVVTGAADPGDFDAYIRTMEKNLQVLKEALK